MSDANVSNAGDEPGSEGNDDSFNSVIGQEVAGPMKTLVARMVANATREYRERHDEETAARRADDDRARSGGLTANAKAFARAFRDEVGDYSPAIEAKMIEIGARISPGDDALPATYLRHLYTLAKKELGGAAPKKTEAPKPAPRARSIRESVTGEREEPAKARRHPLREALVGEPDGGRRRAKVPDVRPDASFEETLTDAFADLLT